jgi:hypothetical protein
MLLYRARFHDIGILTYKMYVEHRSLVYCTYGNT